MPFACIHCSFIGFWYTFDFEFVWGHPIRLVSCSMWVCVYVYLKWNACHWKDRNFVVELKSNPTRLHVQVFRVDKILVYISFVPKDTPVAKYQLNAIKIKIIISIRDLNFDILSIRFRSSCGSKQRPRRRRRVWFDRNTFLIYSFSLSRRLRDQIVYYFD